MCDVANATIIDQIIDEHINGQDPSDMWTAFDITRIAKSRGATENHYQMKNSVHARWNDLRYAGYDRQSITTPTGGTWLYFKQGADIQPYVYRINGGSPAVTQTTTAVVTPSLSTSAVASTGSLIKTQELDSEARLPIYADSLASIDAKPGDKVYVSLNINGLIVSTYNTLTPQLAVYTVNADGRIRISSDVIYSFDKGNSFKVSYNQNFDGANVIAIMPA